MRYWGKNIEIDGSFYGRAGNLLPTAAEMAQLKATGNYYQFEGNVELFEETVQNMLREIEKDPVGQILISKINRSSKTVRIIPLTGKEQFQLKRNYCANLVGNFSKSGNDSVIWYEPWSKIPNLMNPAGNSPFQVLVHELQHSVRQLWGKWYQTGPLVSVSNAAAFPNAEELFSVMIENMYLSSAKQPQRMLGAYMQNVPLGNRSDKDFYKQYGNEIEVWCRDFPDMTALLERVHGIWNPISVRRMVLDFVITL